jgi:hypothetical protein
VKREFLSGTLARLQGYKSDQRRRVLNDALLFATARKHGCSVLTRNVLDFDFLQQLDHFREGSILQISAYAGSGDHLRLRSGALKSRTIFFLSLPSNLLNFFPNSHYNRPYKFFPYAHLANRRRQHAPP